MYIYTGKNYPFLNFSDKEKDKSMTTVSDRHVLPNHTTSQLFK